MNPWHESNMSVSSSTAKPSTWSHLLGNVELPNGEVQSDRSTRLITHLFAAQQRANTCALTDKVRHIDRWWAFSKKCRFIIKKELWVHCAVFFFFFTLNVGPNFILFAIKGSRRSEKKREKRSLVCTFSKIRIFFVIQNVFGLLSSTCHVLGLSLFRPRQSFVFHTGTRMNLNVASVENRPKSYWNDSEFLRCWFYLLNIMRHGPLLGGNFSHWTSLNLSCRSLHLCHVNVLNTSLAHSSL